MVRSSAFRLSGAENTLKRELQTCRAAAFTLIEILVTVALLSFIVLGLLMTFNQVQRAFRNSLGQTDVQEGGRGAMDMMVRELEQATPSEAPILGNVALNRQMSFFAELDSSFSPPMMQALPGTTLTRMNIIQHFFFLTKLNQDWIGTGYMVLPDAPGAMTGSLYRFCMTNSPRYLPNLLSGMFRDEVNNSNFRTNLTRIADGVVHLKLRAFAANGFPIVSDGVNSYAYYRRDGINLNNYGFVDRASASTLPNSAYLDNLTGFYFWSNSVPAYVELEMGILEPNVLQHYKAIDPSTPAARTYLSNRVALVHLFRQRISIRNVDFTAYQ